MKTCKMVLKKQKKAKCQIDEEKLSGRRGFEPDQRHRLNKEQRQQMWRRKLPERAEHKERKTRAEHMNIHDCVSALTSSA